MTTKIQANDNRFYDKILNGLPIRKDRMTTKRPNGNAFNPEGRSTNKRQRNVFSMCSEKTFMDAVHGLMTFHPLIVAIIDTPQFQRLRYIKQLGNTYFVYPSASHNRFEHSLGTCHLAGEYLDALKASNAPHNEKDKLMVQIAAVCHDLGHGPFSHLWQEYVNSYEIYDWKHEEKSLEVLDSILKTPLRSSELRNDQPLRIKDLFAKYELYEYEIEVIKTFIKGSKEFKIEPDKQYLFEIVNNTYNGLDVDKWDYLMRDSLLLGVPIAFNANILIKFAKILRYNHENRICFRDTKLKYVMNTFVSRGFLHRNAYQHRVVLTIDKMVMDALNIAQEEGFQLLFDKIDDFLKLTDNVIFTILNNHNQYPKAAKLLNRIFKRELYQHITNLEINAYKNEVQHEELMDSLKYALAESNKPEIERQNIDVIKKTVTLGTMLIGDAPRGLLIYTKNDPETAMPINSDPFPAIKKTIEECSLTKVNGTEYIVVYTGEQQLDSDTIKKLTAECNLWLSKTL